MPEADLRRDRGPGHRPAGPQKGEESRMLKLTNITKTFAPGTVNQKTALCGIDLHLAPGDFVTVLGLQRLQRLLRRQQHGQ